MDNPFAPFRFFAFLLAVALLAAACGGDDDASTDSSDGDGQTEVEPTDDESTGDDEPTVDDDMTDDDMTDDAAEAKRGTIGESMVGTPLQPGGDPIVDGEVKVYFNNGSNGTLIAIYHGAGLTDPSGLCPGNSLNAGTFEFISNAPAAEDACLDFPTEVGSVRVCTSNVWLYQTKIPNDSAGTLYASLEARVGDTITGHYGTAQNRSGTPVIDYEADVYEITAMFTIDGATEITCAAPLT